MTPDLARSWIRVIRDALFVALGAFMLIYATTHSQKLTIAPLSALITGGLCAAGLPIAFRWEDLFGRAEDR